MEIQPGVYSYELDWQYDEPLGVHVIETDRDAVLFGAGSEGTADRLSEIAIENEIDAVIIEHGDADHYGGVPALREAVNGLDVAAPAGDVSAIEAAGIDVDRPLDAGDTYWGVRAISTPGHMPDNMAYFHEDVLVAGDTVAGADSAFAAADEWSGPLAVIAADYNADDERTRESASVLTEYDVEVVLVSHGANVTENGRDRIQTLIADLE